MCYGGGLGDQSRAFDCFLVGCGLWVVGEGKGRKRVEGWKGGRVEGWKGGRVEGWGGGGGRVYARVCNSCCNFAGSLDSLDSLKAGYCTEYRCKIIGGRKKLIYVF